MQLKVIKADGSVEDYLHTKLIATLSNALGSAGEMDIFLAEQLAEAMTFFLYRDSDQSQVTSSKIMSMTKATLTSTGYSEAAIALSENHHRRNLYRSRIEVVKMNVQSLSDAAKLNDIRRQGLADRWNKSKIIADLISEQHLDQSTARVIASMVEEKIINSQLQCISCSMIKQLVLSDTIAVLNAKQQLQAASSQHETLKEQQDHAGREARLRQRQKGLCPVEV